MSIGKMFKNFALSPFTTAFIATIAVDPDPAKAFEKLYQNVFFRFAFIYIIVLQRTECIRETLFYTIGIMFYFYWLADEEQRKMVVRNNFVMSDFKTFGSIMALMAVMYVVKRYVLML